MGKVADLDPSTGSEQHVIVLTRRGFRLQGNSASVRGTLAAMADLKFMDPCAMHESVDILHDCSERRLDRDTARLPCIFGS